MSLSDKDIEARVTIIVTAFLQGTKIKNEDKPIIEAGVSLITNFLQNINDIANASL
jgi:hypothetical protein